MTTPPVYALLRVLFIGLVLISDVFAGSY
jgi:hypothetical protein